MIRLARGLAVGVVCAGVPGGAIACAPAIALCPPSTVEQFVSWRRADVVTAKLRNGVVVHHRLMPEADDTVVAATITPGFDDDAMSAAAARAAEDALRADPRAAGLRVDVMVVEQGLMAALRGPDERVTDMCGLLAVFAGEPVTFTIEEANSGPTSARAVVRRAMDAVFDQRPFVIRPQLDAAAAVAVPRWPAGDGRGSMEVSVVGGVAFADAIGAADAALGALPLRRAPEVAPVAKAVAKMASHVVTVHTDDVNLAEGREAVAVGLLVRNGETLADQRAIAMAWTLLRLRVTEPDEGADVKPGVNFTPRGLRPGTAVITVTATCSAGDAVEVAARFTGAIKRLAAEPPSGEEFERARSAYLDVARKLLEDSGYWAGVLAACSTRGYTPDELADVEADIKAVTPAQVVAMLARALADQPPVTIHVRPTERVRPAEKVGQP